MKHARSHNLRDWCLSYDWRRWARARARSHLRAHTHRSLTPFDHTITTCRCYLMLHNSYVFLRINRVKMVQLSHSFKPVVCVNKIRNKWFFCAATQITSRFGMVGHNHRIHYTLWITWMGYRILFCVFLLLFLYRIWLIINLIMLMNAYKSNP